MSIETTEIFVNSDDPLIIDKTYEGTCLDSNGLYIPVIVKIIRTAELEEYMEFVTKYNLQNQVNRSINDKYLYLVKVLD